MKNKFSSQYKSEKNNKRRQKQAQYKWSKDKLTTRRKNIKIALEHMKRYLTFNKINAN